jgi:hypothetical protein
MAKGETDEQRPGNAELDGSDLDFADGEANYGH